MRRIGYAVHVDDDKAAKAQVAKLRAELAALASDETTIAGALVEAEERQAEARRTAQAEADAERAKERARLDAEYRQLGKAADAALQTLVDTVVKRHDIQARLRRLGDTRGGELAAVSDKRCVETALMRLGRPFEVIDPNMRLTFQQADERLAPKQRAAA